MLHVSLYYYTYEYHYWLKKHVRQLNNCSNLSVIEDETSHRRFYLTASFFHQKYPWNSLSSTPPVWTAGLLLTQPQIYLMM